MTQPHEPPAEHTNASDSWAEVHANARTTRYRRSGAGRPVVLLTADESLPSGELLIALLGSRCRVIVPELPSDSPPDVDAVSGFLEGLGISGVAIVAVGAWCHAALSLAIGGAGQVSRVALVDRSGDASSVLAATLASAGSPSLPLLIVRGDSADVGLQLAAFVNDAAPRGHA